MNIKQLREYIKDMRDNAEVKFYLLDKDEELIDDPFIWDHEIDLETVFDSGDKNIEYLEFVVRKRG